MIDERIRIQENYDICVLEGAGSPAEINLKKDHYGNRKIYCSAAEPAEKRTQKN